MRGPPSSPRGWLRWTARILEAQASPFSPRFDHVPRGDFRLRDSRETALSVKILLERASAKCTSNGVGYDLLRRYYVEEAAWSCFTETEQRIIARTARAFAKALRVEGFLPREG